MNRTIQKFQKLAERAELHKGTLASTEKYRKLCQNEPDVANIGSIIEGFDRALRLRPGDLIIFEYFAKTNLKLPYWDRYPLVLVTGVNKDGWEGYNLHYLHPRIRSRLTYESKKGISSIAGNELTRPAFKKYLQPYVLRTAREIPPDLWDVVINIPFENFAKANKYTVWRNTSRKKK